MNFYKALVLVAALGAWALQTPAAAQQRGPHILIVGEDADPDTVPRGNQVYERFLDEIVAHLVARGFQVTREGAAGLKVTPPRERQDTDELIEAARAFNANPIDALAVLRIYSSVKPLLELRGSFKQEARIVGRVLSIRRNQEPVKVDLGGFEAGRDVELPVLSIESMRNAEGLLDKVASTAPSFGAPAAAAIAARLAAAGGGK